jgi:hypothetical protein
MHRRVCMTVAMMLLGGCGLVCENEISQTVRSPSGKTKAVVFNRGCGATVGLNTQVSVLPSDAALPNDGGNLLIVDGTVPLKIEWQSDAELSVKGQLNTPIFKQEASVTGVHITYGN